VADACRRLGLAWVSLVVVTALLEVGIDFWIRARVPTEDAWREAAAFVRREFEPSDRLVAAPHWVEPIVRHHLGGLLSLSTASEREASGDGRIWEVSIRGAGGRARSPNVDEAFGGVRVRAWPIEGDEILFDFVEEIAQAEVQVVVDGARRPCPWRAGRVRGGGLGWGPLPGRHRFRCDPSRPWLWVGATVMADLSLRPRRCIWHHPAGAEPVRVTFSDVPLGDTLSVGGGLDYNNDRTAGGAPVRLRIFVEDEVVGDLRHHARTGWSTLEIDTARFSGTRREVRFETTSPVPHGRTFCWSATTRREREDR